MSPCSMNAGMSSCLSAWPVMVMRSSIPAAFTCALRSASSGPLPAMVQRNGKPRSRRRPQARIRTSNPFFSTSRPEERMWNGSPSGWFRRRGEMRGVEPAIGDEKLFGPRAVGQEEAAVEFRDADDELRPPDLVAERRAVAEEVRRMAGEAERHAQKPGAVHGDRAARMDPLGMDEPHVLAPERGRPVAGDGEMPEAHGADAERFPFARQRVPQRAEEPPAEAERRGQNGRRGGGFRQRVDHPRVAVDRGNVVGREVGLGRAHQGVKNEGDPERDTTRSSLPTHASPTPIVVM
jgi:hypothetical protein